MEISVETIKTPILTLIGREVEILTILGNSRVISDVLFKDSIGKTLSGYGLTKDELYTFLSAIPNIDFVNGQCGGKINDLYPNKENT